MRSDPGWAATKGIAVGWLVYLCSSILVFAFDFFLRSLPDGMSDGGMHGDLLGILQGGLIGLLVALVFHATERLAHLGVRIVVCALQLPFAAGWYVLSNLYYVLRIGGDSL